LKIKYSSRIRLGNGVAGMPRRPCQIEPHCWAILIPPDQFSFLSGHTMTSFAAALVIGHAYSGLPPILFFLAVNIAISRIVLGMHFLPDVLVGALLGIAIGLPCLSLL
jgi:undecaprenyl-diphosphatase